MRQEAPSDERVDIEFSYRQLSDPAQAHNREAKSLVDVEVTDPHTPKLCTETASVADLKQVLVDSAVQKLHLLLDVCLECNLSPNRCHELKSHLPCEGATAQALVQVCQYDDCSRLHAQAFVRGNLPRVSLHR